MIAEKTTESIPKITIVVTVLLMFGFLDMKGQDIQDRVELPELREKLLQMQAEDQKVRQVLIAKMKKSDGPMDMEREEFSKERSKMDSVTIANSDRLEAIINQHGWPDPQKVGQQGTIAAFMILQHAGLKLQEKLLPVLKEEYGEGRLSGQSLALLTDRVLKKQGKKQIYGTQADFKNGDIVFHPIKDSTNVDQRRGKMGLPPLEQYRKMMRKVYLQQQEAANN